MEPKLTPSQAELTTSTKELVSTTLPSIQTSQKKIEANRRNALRSTGPKTERGKRTVSRNALKHGLLARNTLIREGLGVENVDKFDQLLSAFWEDCQPVGISEEFLVATIATCYWRLGLVFRLEMGETRKRADSDTWLHTIQKMTEINRKIYVLEYRQLYGCDAAQEELSIEEGLEAKQKEQISLLCHPLGIEYVRNVLVETKAEIQKKGSLSNHAFKQLTFTIGACDRSLVLACAALEPERNDESKAELCGSSMEDNSNHAKVGDREVALGFLDRWLGLLEAVDKDLGASHRQGASSDLPDMENIDKVLRYEAHVNRILYRAMDQLERLQRGRKGENVPPPLNVNLGRRHDFAKQSQKVLCLLQKNEIKRGQHGCWTPTTYGRKIYE